MNYPINLILKGKRVLLVGAGAIAQQKLRTLQGTGAQITVIAKEIHEDFSGNWAQFQEIQVKEIQESDVFGYALVIAATNQQETNRQVVRWARQQQIWANAVDDPDYCDFYVPAIVQSGPIQISISSHGTSPTLAKAIKEDIKKTILFNGIEDFATTLGHYRERVKKTWSDFASRKAFWDRVFAQGIIGLARFGDKKAVQEILEIELKGEARRAS